MSNSTEVFIGAVVAIVAMFFVFLGTSHSQEACTISRTQIEDFLKSANPQAITVELTTEQENHLKAAYAFHGYPLNPTITHVLTSSHIQEGAMYLFMFDDSGCLVIKGPLEMGRFNRAIAGEEEGPAA